MRQLWLRQGWIWAATLPACFLFLFLASRHIESPGAYYDEALQANTAVFLTRKEVRTAHCSVWDLQIAGRTIPIMCGEYIGAVKSYVLAPSFYLFGSKVSVMRLTMVVVALLGLLWAVGFVRRVGGTWAAGFAAWLMATDPSLIMLSRNDWGPVAIAFTLRMGGIYYLIRWWRSGGKRAPLTIAAALLGLGVWDKTNFLWVVVALMVAGGWVWLVKRPRPRLTAGDLAVASITWLAASAPLWIYNLRFDWITFRMVKMPGQKVTLATLLESIPPRTGDLVALLDGGGVAHWMFRKPIPPILGISETILLPMALAASLVYFAICLARRRWAWLGLLLLTGIMIAEIYATPRHVWLHHWIGIYPLPHLIIALAGGLCWTEARRFGRWAKTAIAAMLLTVLAATVGANLIVMQGYHRLMREEGGAGLWSEAINTLSEQLNRKYADRDIQIMDWGVTNQLVMLSGGSLKMIEHFFRLGGKTEPDEDLLRAISSPRSIFLLPARPVLAPQAGTLLETAARHTGMILKSEEKILDRRGKVVYIVLAYRPAAEP